MPNVALNTAIHAHKSLWRVVMRWYPDSALDREMYSCRFINSDPVIVLVCSFMVQ